MKFVEVHASCERAVEELINRSSKNVAFKTERADLRLASYILIELAPGTSKAAAEAISKIGGVKMAHAVTGPFDIIAFAEVPDLATLSDLVLAKIQNVAGVQKTQTAVVVTPDVLEPRPSGARKNRSHRSD